MYCPSCGTDIYEGDIYCPSCKKKLPYSTIIEAIEITEAASVETPAAKPEYEVEINIDGDLQTDDAWYILTNSCRFLFKKPIFILPISFSWVLLMAAAVYLQYYFQFPDSFFLSLLYIYLIIFLFSITICIANLMMIEFIQQIESGQNISFTRTFGASFGINLIKAVPLAMVCGPLWIILVILRILTSRKRGNKKTEPSVKEIKATLADLSFPLLFFDLSLRLTEKLTRMVVFLALPSIAWENQGPLSAIKRAFHVIEMHTTQFLTTYTLTFATSVVLGIPLVTFIVLDSQVGGFPKILWTVVILFEGFVWSLSVYLEQMATAMLYLWHVKWTKNGAKGKLNSVSKPDLFDAIYELK